MTRNVANKPVVQRLRCAVYTRKSTEEGLDMAFNSLDAQREACHAYIASQKPEGWIPVRDDYDDGGFSGGNLDRPALKRLIQDIEDGLVDVVVVYKIDRLSRSLMDFSKLVDVFDRHGVTFVSVTQSFNTTTSMGRLTLNILLSFAQFEREVIGERVRDKVAASRKKGMWMGGWVPMGYRVEDRKLVVDDVEALIVRSIFERFLQLGSATLLAKELQDQDIRTRSGKVIDKGVLYKMINNPVYRGDAVHKGTAYPGQHEAIISPELWVKVHSILADGPRSRACKTRAQTPALLKGLLFAPNSMAMTPTHTRRRGKLYRYYVTMSVVKLSPETCPIRRIGAGEIEGAVMDQLRVILRSPEVIARTAAAARQQNSAITDDDVRQGIQQFDNLWDQLFPAEQARIIQLLVERVDLDTDGAAIKIRTDGLSAFATELPLGTKQREAA
jgi:site-specific DNA recombinase